MIGPTREEWLAARERLAMVSHFDNDALIEAALGCPCPPEPVPEPLLKDGSALMLVWIIQTPQNAVPCWVGVPGQALHPDEADAMAAALIEHARYAREQEPASDVCGRLLDWARPVTHCHLPKGHAGICKAASA